MNLMNMTKWFRMQYYLWKGVLWRQEGYFRESGSGDFIIGRVAVLPEFRGRNLGAQIMLALEQEARRVGGKRISLSAQCRASGFYQTLGYREIGEAYLDEFCPHILMEKSL